MALWRAVDAVTGLGKQMVVQAQRSSLCWSKGSLGCVSPSLGSKEKDRSVFPHPWGILMVAEIKTLCWSWLCGHQTLLQPLTDCS